MITERVADHPIEPIFLMRWSPRAFDGSPMPAEDLLTILEAARWAPSAFNIQPWRLLYSLRDDTHWPKYLTLLDQFNEGWAQHASALVIVLSDSVVDGHNGEPEKHSRYNSFDTGAAWAQLALQAAALGYQAHAMAGINLERVRQELIVPERFRVEVAIAIGTRADPSMLPDALQGREQPSQRLPFGEIAFAGAFPQ